MFSAKQHTLYPWERDPVPIVLSGLHKEIYR